MGTAHPISPLEFSPCLFPLEFTGRTTFARAANVSAVLRILVRRLPMAERASPSLTVESIQSQIDEAFQHLSSATELADTHRLREEIVAYGGRLTELRYRHEQDIEEDERRYNEEQSRILQSLCSKVVSIVGQQTMKQAIQSLEGEASPCESAQSLEPTDRKQVDEPETTTQVKRHQRDLLDRDSEHPESDTEMSDTGISATRQVTSPPQNPVASETDGVTERSDAAATEPVHNAVDGSQNQSGFAAVEIPKEPNLADMAPMTLCRRVDVQGYDQFKEASSVPRTTGTSMISRETFTPRVGNVAENPMQQIMPIPSTGPPPQGLSQPFLGQPGLSGYNVPAGLYRSNNRTSAPAETQFGPQSNVFNVPQYGSMAGQRALGTPLPSCRVHGLSSLETSTSQPYSIPRQTNGSQTELTQRSTNGPNWGWQFDRQRSHGFL